MDIDLLPAVVIFIAFVAVVAFPKITLLVAGAACGCVAALYSYGVNIGAQIGTGPESSLPFLFLGLFMVGFARWAMQER